MPIDFGKLTTNKQLKSLKSPRDIFTSLPSKAPGFGYLRDVQGQVLDSWEERRDERDLAIKMNTGGGKTLVGLLILQSCLNDGLGPALYVAPSTYLAQQVTMQADRLGIPTVVDPEAVRYLSGESIGVVNIHKLVNGRSVFGGPQGRPIPLPIGSVVIDDVHAAIATIEEQTTVEMPSSHPVYSTLLERFSEDLRRQSESTFLDIQDGLPSAVLRVPFWAWADRSAEVTRILHEHREDDELTFTWPLLLMFCLSAKRSLPAQHLR
ncbi:MAG: DEAD/DEAH box helicase [Actinomycetota bacterium]